MEGRQEEEMISQVLDDMHNLFGINHTWIMSGTLYTFLCWGMNRWTWNDVFVVGWPEGAD